MLSPGRTPRSVVLTAPDSVCPFCGIGLQICQHRDRSVTCLTEDLVVIMKDKRCPSPTCPNPQLRFRSPEESRIALPHDKVGLDVILEVGYLRFHQELGFPRIQETLKNRGLSISSMGVQYQSRKYEALVACHMNTAQGAVFAKLKARGFLLPIVDAVHYGAGEAVVYLIIDGLTGIPLFGWGTMVRGKVELVPFLRQVHTLGLPLIGIVSDKETGLAPAIAEAFPGVRHQFCQRHYLDNVAKPMEKDLAALGEEVRGREEKLREFHRGLIRVEAQAEAKGTPVPADMKTAMEFCEAARAGARIHGKTTTDPAPIKRQKELERVQKAVSRASRKKGGVGLASRNCRRSCARHRKRSGLPDGFSCA
jgi:hypothetical protein